MHFYPCEFDIFVHICEFLGINIPRKKHNEVSISQISNSKFLCCTFPNRVCLIGCEFAFFVGPNFSCQVLLVPYLFQFQGSIARF